MQPTVCLHATIPSFYYEDRPGTIIQAWRDFTVALWEQRDRYEFIVSDETLRELLDPAYPEDKRLLCLALVADLPRLAVTSEVQSLADYYVQEMAMPSDDYGERVPFSPGHLVPYRIPVDVELQAPSQRQQVRTHPCPELAPAARFARDCYARTIIGV